MLWRYEWRTGLRLVDASTEQIAQALSAIGELERSNTGDAKTTGSRLRHGLQDRRLPEEVVFSLSCWCDSEGKYKSGVEPARRISRELFNGQILPRLRPARGVKIGTYEARDMLQCFLKGAGALDSGRNEIRPSQVSESERADDVRLGDADRFPIHGRSSQTIHTLEDWFREAAPAGGLSQWREGRSAMELARRWLPGGIPKEVQRLLDGTEAFVGFVPDRGAAESKTPLDGYGGNTRNHDLIVIGRAQGARAHLDIEGKADETFGETVSARLAAAEAYLQENPRSNALSRVRELCAAIFDREPQAVGDLRYQLLHATAAALIRARQDGADRVAFIVHEFQSASTNEVRSAANAADLAAFVRTLGGDGSMIAADRQLVGPFFVLGNARVPADVALYVGKAVCVL